jgi:hypothetical protein
MNPASGRFTQHDSWNGNEVDSPSLHKYTVNHNNSVNRVDPSGNQSLISLTMAVNIVSIGSTAIHAGFNIAEGDYRGAAKNVVVGLVLIGAASAAPKLIAAGSVWWKSFSAFSAAERGVIAEAKVIQSTGLFERAKTAIQAGRDIEVTVGQRTIVVSHELRDSGMTLFGENGFIIGRNAITSEAEFAKTLLHELYRLEFQQGVQAGAAGGAATATQQAFQFADRAWTLLVR